ncbi:energy-coupled thiamine transporter ThiT [Lacticaseibacillus zhaodongensis]|uniref:energy-coupled thiamine transporter ThiT n=1 Tax=Lacticaseibacillus zhaodongensis TaxID=2668065 RepID=UPI0012D33893|nr:energy-coupled thiamine transporter ThiT [Lacticaseibacillus zhaodongensis]
MDNKRLRVLVEAALIVAFTEAINYIPHTFGVSSIELQMGLIPMAVFALRRGVGPGLAAGFVWGILDMFLRGIPGGSVLNAVQGILEYPIAFTVVGLCGLLAGQFQADARAGRTSHAAGAMVAGVIIAGCAKYFCHFVAGVIFWGSYAPKGQSPVLYSLIINGGSAVVSIVFAVLVLIVLWRMAPRLFTAQE